MVEDDGRGVFVMTTEIGTRFVTPGESRNTSDSEDPDDSKGSGPDRRSSSRRLNAPKKQKRNG